MVIAPAPGMAKTSAPLETPLRDKLDQLARFEPTGFPVISLYLDLTADQHGRETHEVFCRKAFAERLKALAPDSPEHGSVLADIDRIDAYLAGVPRSANGLVIFASAGSGDFFETVQLDVPLGEHWLFVGTVPHLYPLARVADQYPRYAVVALDTNHARILVFALGAVEKRDEVTGVKTRRSDMGGMSQARYQRHAENFHLHHVRDVASALDRVVREDAVQHVVLAGDEVVIPMLKEKLTPAVAEKIVDVIPLDRQADDNRLARTTLDVLRRSDAQNDVERVEAVLGAWRAGGLGVAGPHATMTALQQGQVDELLMVASPTALTAVQSLPDAAPVVAETSAPNVPDDRQLQLAHELVTGAHATGARVRIIEDPALLEEHGGVAASLRFRI